MPPLGRRDLDAGDVGQQAAPACRGRLAGARRSRGVISSPCAERGDAGALGEDAGAGGVELDQLAHAVHQRRRQHQPAEAPAGHQEALGEAVGDHQAVVRRRRCRGSWARSRWASARSTAARRPRRPGSRCRCARQWSRIACCSARVSVQPVGLFGALTISSLVAGVTAARSASRSSVHSPCPRHQRHAAHRGAEDRRLRREVGPHRRDGDHLVARIDQRLHRQHQRVDAARGDRRCARPRSSDAGRSCRRRRPRAVRAGPGCGRRRSRRAAATRWRPARMTSGVTSSLSPNQKASTSLRPRPALATSRILEASRSWIAWRMVVLLRVQGRCILQVVGISARLARDRLDDPEAVARALDVELHAGRALPVHHADHQRLLELVVRGAHVAALAGQRDVGLLQRARHGDGVDAAGPLDRLRQRLDHAVACACGRSRRTASGSASRKAR